MFHNDRESGPTKQTDGGNAVITEAHQSVAGNEVAMISHIALAHRVSTIRASYWRIHSAIFGLSLGGIKSIWPHDKRKSEYCRYEEELRQLDEELAQIKAMVETGEDLDLSTTLNREFNDALKEYVGALGNAVARLGNICGDICKELTGVRFYDEAQSRADRIAYDETVQYYQRLGGRLDRLFKLL